MHNALHTIKCPSHYTLIGYISNHQIYVRSDIRSKHSICMDLREEIIKECELMAKGKKMSRKMRADKASSAGNEDFHVK